MSAWLVAVVGLIYAAVAADQAWRGHYWLAVVFAGYAFSNVGLWKLTQ